MPYIFPKYKVGQQVQVSHISNEHQYLEKALITGFVRQIDDQFSYNVVFENGNEYEFSEYELSPCIELPKDIAQQPHYTQWKIQPITFISANGLNFSQGNVIKYVLRYKEKNGIEDLKKAKVYIDYLIQELETGEVKP